MSNPDIKVPTTDSLTVAFPVAILFFLITLTIFQFKESLQPFKYILWISFPIITVIIVAATNAITQYITCKTVNMGKALLGSLPSVGTVLLGLGISSISYCRIPVASVFAPLMIGQTIDVTKDKNTTNINSLKNSNSKECCIPKLSLETIESKYPLIEGISYGFYMLFSILFGVVIGTGMSTIC
jgi:hypothetical protein